MRDPENQHPTQATLILDHLKSRPGEWVDMPALYAVSGAFAVHSRVAELRADGHRIECRVLGARPRRSQYRLLSPTAVSTAAAMVLLAGLLVLPGCAWPTFGNDRSTPEERAVRPGGDSETFHFNGERWERTRP